MYRTAAVGALLLLPTLTLGAGFAKQSIFLSRSAVVEGDTILVHAVVQNDSSAKFPGNVSIRDGDEAVGSVPVTLAANEARVVSVSWTPSASGSHTVTAELKDAAGAVVESESEDFSVAAKPKPKVVTKNTSSASSSVAAAIESSQKIQDQIDGLSPAAGGVLAPVFKLVDGSRTAVADVLDDQLAKTKPKVANNPIPGVVAGAETIKAPEQQSWFWSMLYTVYYYILTVLRFIVGSAAVFYPVFVLIVAYILWKTYRKFRRA